MVALSGYHRKAAIRLLRKGRKPKRWDRRGRPRVYTNQVKAALLEVWEVCGQVCSKRLQPFLPEIVEVLEREGELTLPPETERLLVRMSPATIDRLLQTHRYRRPRSTTKPGSLLRRAYAEELDCRPSVDRLPEARGLFEAIYKDWRLFMNFFQPVRKLVEKERVGREVRKRYDRAQIPRSGCWQEQMWMKWGRND
mgnify:CR=1 FL=1